MPANVSISIEDASKRPALFGPTDRNLRQLREAFGISVVPRGDEIRLSGPPEAVDKAAEVIGRWQKQLRQKDFLTPEDVSRAFDAVRSADAEGGIDVFSRGAIVHAKTAGQQRYIDAMFSNDLTFCVGPAGSGKTYLAVAAAASLLKQGKVRRLILARPAVEAGERLGFLPGDLAAKVNPYLRPLFDALHDMMDGEQAKRLMFNDVIEVIPLAFMRGRTFNESAIILDEAQNTTVSQMLMFLTRLGNSSKMIVTGDTSQVDLPPDTPSGLMDALDRLNDIKGIASVRLEKSDIVRHRLVQNIVMAYEGDPETNRP
ncbi:MAG TPA: PhoH family protein [Tepidisphaeraceae bacterium]|jgi:phosphate starvation-inducible PhoH-like protein